MAGVVRMRMMTMTPPRTQVFGSETSPQAPCGQGLVPHGGIFRTMRNLSEVWHSEKKKLGIFTEGGEGQSPDPLPSPSLLPAIK